MTRETLIDGISGKLTTLQKPSLQVIAFAGKPGRPIDHRPQVDNLPHTAPSGPVSEPCDGHLTYTRESGESVTAGYTLHSTTPNSWSVLIGNRSYRVTPGPGGQMLVNGRAYTVETFDPRDRRARQSASVNQGAQKIISPMPGRVVRVLVSVGDAVEQGQGLVVVEAMKMQNEMKSPKAGRVVEVKAAPEATVTAGQVLVIVE